MKTALITGASTGIGRALAEQFAKNGISLILVARRTGLLEELADDLISRYPIQVRYQTCDLTDIKQIDGMIKNFVQDQVKVNYLINNAGMGIQGDFDQMDSEGMLQMLQLNVVSMTYLTRCFLNSLTSPDECKILNVASTAAFQPVPYFAVYSATKAYVLSFSEAIAVELKGKNVTVTTICPGETETEFITLSGLNKLNRVKKEKLPTAAEVASFGFKQLIAGRSLAIYGWKNRLSVFGQRFVPRKMVMKIAENLYK